MKLFLIAVIRFLWRYINLFCSKISDFIYVNKCGICNCLTNKYALLCCKCWGTLIFVNKPYCSKCGKLFTVDIFENMICGWCLKHKPKYKYQRVLMKFNLSAKILIHKFKYYDTFHYGKYFAKIMYIRYLKNIEFDVIVPTPMHKKRRVFRQYNQIQVLGNYLAKISKKPLINTSLLKSKNTKQQSILGKKARMSNLSGSFYVKDMYLIKNKCVLLVDDVITTGSTIKNCTEVLLKNGAKEVIVLALCYT